MKIEKAIFSVSEPAEYVTVFGTPEEVETFEAWQKIISSPQKINNEYDLIRCYNYWKKYNEQRNS